MELFNINDVTRTILYMLNDQEYNLDVRLAQINDNYVIMDLDEYNYNMLVKQKRNTIMSFIITIADGILLIRAAYMSENKTLQRIYLRNIQIIKKIQRRNFARIPFRASIPYTILTKNTINQNNDLAYNIIQKTKHNKVKKINRIATCVNVSISGACYKIPEKINKDDIISITFTDFTTVNKNVCVLGTVAYCKKKDNYYIIGIDFSINPDNIKDILAKEFLVIQRQYLQEIKDEEERKAELKAQIKAKRTQE